MNIMVNERGNMKSFAPFARSRLTDFPAAVPAVGSNRGFYVVGIHPASGP
jgi:hypothetical protein